MKIKELKIRVKSESVTVSEEIYTAYYRMVRRERYLEEVSVRHNLSNNQLIGQDYPVEEKMLEPQPPLEDIIIEKIMRQKLMSALKELTEQEWLIINELFFEGTSMRDLSADLSVPRSTLHEQKDKIIKLKKIINIF